MDASIAPVPEQASIKTSFLVPKRLFNPWRASSNTLLNCGVRWWIIVSDIAKATSLGTGVGPGDRRYCLIIVLFHWLMGNLKTTWRPEQRRCRGAKNPFRRKPARRHKQKSLDLSILRDPGVRPSYCFALPRGRFHVRQSRKTYQEFLSGKTQDVNAFQQGDFYLGDLPR
jgi:hypothetical protein